MRHVLDLDLGLALLGDVLMGGNPTLVGHRSMADLDGPPVHQFDDAVLGFIGNAYFRTPAHVLLARHRRKTSRFIAKIDDFGKRRAGPDAAGRKAVHLDKAIVAHDQLVVGVEEAQALRHVVDGGVELEVSDTQGLFLLLAQLILLLEAGMEFFALGDVFMGRDPAAIGQRTDGVGDDAAVGEFLDGGVERDIAPDALTYIFVGRHPGFQAQFEAVPDQIAGRRARASPVRA